MSRRWAWVLLLAWPGVAGAVVESGPWQFMGGTDLFLGQYYFQNSAGSLNGLVDASFQQARSASAESGFYFDERSLYTGFKQVNELAGGGTLFQQTWDNSIGAKWIRRFEGGYSLKPRLGFRYELFRETRDESWGDGLYDNQRYEGGLTWDRKTRIGLSVPWTYAFSWDFYYTHYPRLRSLASQFGAALAAPSAGDHILDTVTNQFSFRSDFDFPSFASAYLLYSLAFVNFADQKIVNSQGQYLDAQRSDAFQSLSLGAAKRLDDWQALGRVRPVFGAGTTFNSLISNQNNFDTDPSRLKFVGGYYNYWELHLSPNASFLFLRTLARVTATYDLGFRQYTSRLAQNADASYTSSKLHQLSSSLTLDASYPLLSSLELRARGVWALTDANTAFQQTYVYTYHSYNYFVGVSWKL